MFYIVDNYTKMVEGNYETQGQADEALEKMEKESGLFVWDVVEAANEQELQDKLAWEEPEQGEEYDEEKQEDQMQRAYADSRAFEQGLYDEGLLDLYQEPLQEKTAHYHTLDGQHIFYGHQDCIEKHPINDPFVNEGDIALAEVPENAECSYCLQPVHGTSMYEQGLEKSSSHSGKGILITSADIEKERLTIAEELRAIAGALELDDELPVGIEFYSERLRGIANEIEQAKISKNEVEQDAMLDAQEREDFAGDVEPIIWESQLMREDEL